MKALTQIVLAVALMTAVAYCTVATIRIHKLEDRVSVLERAMPLVAAGEAHIAMQRLEHQLQQPRFIMVQPKPVSALSSAPLPGPLPDYLRGFLRTEFSRVEEATTFRFDERGHLLSPQGQ